MISYKIGIYQIKNTITGYLYIGCTVTSFTSRWKDHRELLERGVHTNRRLQKAWSKDGARVFHFSVLDIVSDPSQIFICEQYWIKRLAKTHYLYNYRHYCPW